jgi:PAS domain-containing protein
VTFCFMPPPNPPTPGATPPPLAESNFPISERAAELVVIEQARQFRATGDFRLLNALPIPLLVLNRQRQIIFANPPACGLAELAAAGSDGTSPGRGIVLRARG